MEALTFATQECHL